MLLVILLERSGARDNYTLHSQIQHNKTYFILCVSLEVVMQNVLNSINELYNHNLTNIKHVNHKSNGRNKRRTPSRRKFVF